MASDPTKTTTVTTSPSEELMQRIRAKTDLIVKQQNLADAGLFRSMGAALSLQKLRNERKALQGQLPPLRIIP